MCKNGHTICVDTNAIAAQLATGSVLGQCGSWKESNPAGVTTTTIAADAIKIYPNPTDGVINIEIPAAHIVAEIVITDITGRVIESRSISDNKGVPVQFNLSRVAPGIYFVKVNAGESKFIDKLIVR